MQREERDEYDDGFSSNEEERSQIFSPKIKDRSLEDDKPFLNHLIFQQLTPPQQVKTKTYSLQPDILTGWAPKFNMPKPIPLTYSDDILHETISVFQTIHPSEAQLTYLGPQFNSTYSAWKVLGVQFPYSYLNEKPITLTERRFCGNRQSIQTQTLQFQSMFESGNLDAVFKVQQYQYDCFMRVDANTRGHLQWYYFKIMNIKPKTQYRINICNFQKGKTLYLRGMKPYIYSYRQNQLDHKGWRQGGKDIQYTKKKAKIHSILDIQNEEKYYKLSFTISTDYQNDTLQVAYCPPYTYTKLCQFLQKIKNKYKNIVSQEILCTSLGGIKIPLLTITDHVSEQEDCFKAQKIYKHRKIIFVMGRIHPGESNGSYLMEGFISWLCCGSRQSDQLRSKFVFKIIPMVNPDGVIIGNYRTGLSGRDFNREFIDPDHSMFVQIYKLKQFLQRCKSIYQHHFSLFLDFHGHTAKKNVFTYGPDFPISNSKYYECRLFPKLLSRKTKMFRYYSCVFKVTPGKQATARAVLLRQIGIPFTYTLEASNGCYFDHRVMEDSPFVIDDWLNCGQKIGETIFDYWIFIKGIEQIKQKRHKQKEQMLKTKNQRTKRIQSSILKNQTVTISHRNKGSNTPMSNTTIQFSHTKKDFMLKQIMDEISNDDLKDREKCSDDEMSEGKSDSQNSKDDLDFNEIKQIFDQKNKNNKKEIISFQSEKKRTYAKPLKLLKRGSFITQFDQQIQKKPTAQKPKRVNVVRKKILSMNGTPSPVRQQQSNNNTAKIINLSFLLNPIQTFNTVSSMPQQKSRKMKTQMQQYDNRNMQMKQDYSESFRKTFLSLQRQMLKKDTQKKISINNFLQNQRHSIRIDEIVGRRIFGDPN